MDSWAQELGIDPNAWVIAGSMVLGQGLIAFCLLWFLRGTYMISLRQLAGGVAAVAIVASFAGQAAAQQTTSNLRGTVTNSTGAGVSGAQVTILHVPSGSVRQISTGSDGSYTARGLRPGGPYILTVVAPGNAAYRVEDLFLSLADTKRLNVSLDDVIREDAIVVTASSIVTGNLTMGAGSRFGLDTIQGVPTTTRDFKDVLKLDPSVYLDPTNQNAISISGGNNRMLSITVDGVQQNDKFGLNGSGFPTLRSPISIDAIAAINVEKTPFNVEFSGFEAGSVNVVTKSGTNDFHGSAFGYRRNSSFTGGGLNVDEWSYGGTLGGPIIKDKLFFFASYDRFEATNIFTRGPAGSGAVDEVSEVTLNDISEVQRISRDVYGFDPLGFNANNLKEIDEKMLFKLDWNINENHRASLTHQRAKGNQLRPQNSFANRIGLLSNWYNNSQKLRSTSFQLFSDWTDKLSTEIKVAFKNSPTDQAPLGGLDFAQFRIDTPGGGRIYLGPDVFRQANDLDNDTWTYKFNADYSTGNHLLTFGAEREKTDIQNLFVPFSRGDYTFSSIADFENQVGSIFYINAVSGNPLDAGADWSFSINSLYIQDEWDVSDQLTLLFGVRYEDYGSTDSITENPNFVSRFGFSNTATLSGRDIILPRVGFTWTPDDTTKIFGGFGLFSGGAPSVWVSNNYSNDGVTQDSIFVFRPAVVDGFNIPIEASSGLVAGDGNVNALDPNFNIPSNWKFTLGIEKEADVPFVGDFLGSDWTFKADAIYTSVKDANFWQDIACSVTGTVSDGRPLNTCDPDRFDVLLTNTSVGHGTVLSFLAAKSFTENFDFRTTYSHQNIKDANSGVSSTATSNLGRNAAFDRNTPIASTANYEREHRFTFNFDYRKSFFGDNQTRFTLFGETKSGQPFSYTFDDRTNRGSLSEFGFNREFARRDSQLFYVPTGAGDSNVDLSGISDLNAFFSFLESSGLNKYAGEIAPRNAFRTKWVARWDLGIKQEIPGIFPAAAKGILSMDIRNIGNLIDGGWGNLQQISFPYVEPLVRATVDANGQLAYSNFSAGPNRLTTFSQASNWSVQFGLKYQF